jgi:hypothetical protein
MKSLLPILTFLFGIIPLSTWAQPSSPTEFIAAYRTAVQEKSTEKLDALTYTVGMSEADKEGETFRQEASFSDKEIEEISLKPIPADHQWVYIVKGWKWEPTYLPVGVIKIKYKRSPQGGFSFGNPYAIIGGHYFLVAYKRTDLLGAKRPPDES